MSTSTRGTVVAGYTAHAPHIGLQVAHVIAVKLDHDLVMLDVPVTHGRDPAERSPTIGYYPPASVYEAPPLRSRTTLMELACGAAESEDFLIRCLTERDAVESLAGQGVKHSNCSPSTATTRS